VCQGCVPRIRFHRRIAFISPGSGIGMKSGSRQIQVAAWGILAMVLITIGGVFFRSQLSRSHLPEYGEIQSFALTNQLGQMLTLQDLKGNVWVADIIFTSCPGPCPRMTEEMSKLHNTFPADAPLRFVTLTTHPENDSPAVLKAYAQKFGADPQRWQFVTGSKSELLQNLAVGSLKLAAVEKDEAERQNADDLFIHSTTFVMVDKRGKIRGFYESLEPGFQEKILPDIKSLLRERP
jgi:protein SCO1